MMVTRSGSLVLARGEGMLDTPDVAQLTGAIDARLSERRPFLVVGDALAVQGLTAPARRHLGEHRKAKMRSVSHLDLGLVVAVRSPIVRGAMTAISWLSGAFADLRMVELRSELAVTAREMHRSRSIPLSAADEAALEAFVND